MTRDDINKALNILTGLSLDYEDRNAEEIKELDDALDVVQMAAQAYEQLGADAYKTAAQDDRNKEYARGFAESREAVEIILADQGVLYLVTNADFRDVDTITLQPEKGEAVKYIRATERPQGELANDVELEKKLHLMKEQLFRLCSCLYPHALGKDDLDYIVTGDQKGGAE